MLGALPPDAHGLHWNEDGIELAADRHRAPRNARKAAERRASASAASRGASSFILRSTRAALDGWYAAWGSVLAPAGVTEAGARAADARHLPGQAALSTAIFGAFARLVRTRPADPSAHA